MSSLKELLSSEQEIVDLIVYSEGEINEDIEKALAVLNSTLATKVDACERVLSRLEHEEAYFKEKADSFNKVANSFKASRQRLKDYLKETMLANGKTELQGDNVTLKLSQREPKLELDELTLPIMFFKEKIEYIPDRDKIRGSLQEGLQVVGAQLKEVWAMTFRVKKP